MNQQRMHEIAVNANQMVFYVAVCCVYVRCAMCVRAWAVTFLLNINVQVLRRDTKINRNIIKN